MIPYLEALEIVLRAARALPGEEVPLREVAGRILAKDVLSDVDVPPFNKSAMDGYAVRSEDVCSTPVELKILETIPAGRMSGRSVGSGECAKIMTGAPVPAGADAVVMVEHTEPAEEDTVRILRPVKACANICRQGEDIRRGNVVVKAGTVLRPAEVGLLATTGCVEVPVRAVPRAAIVTTGNEIVEPERTPLPGQIRNANSYLLSARLKKAGAEAEYLGVAADDETALRGKISAGLDFDILLVSGGVSMGDYDLVPKVLRKLRVEIAFEKIAVKPGKPTVFGTRGGTLVFGLPGNPVSTVLIAELLLMPVLRKMSGAEQVKPAFFDVVLDGSLSHKGDRDSYLPVRLTTKKGTNHAAPVEYHGTADLMGLSRGNAWAVVPAGVKKLNSGALTRALEIP